MFEAVEMDKPSRHYFSECVMVKIKVLVLENNFTVTCSPGSCVTMISFSCPVEGSPLMGRSKQNWTQSIQGCKISPVHILEYVPIAVYCLSTCTNCKHGNKANSTVLIHFQYYNLMYLIPIFTVQKNYFSFAGKTSFRSVCALCFCKHRIRCNPNEFLSLYFPLLPTIQLPSVHHLHYHWG